MGTRYSHPLEAPPTLPKYPTALVPDQQVVRTEMKAMCPNGGQPFLCAEGRVWFLCQSRMVYAANAFGALVERWGSLEFRQMCAVLTEHGQIPMMTNALYIEKHRRIVFVVPPLFVHTTNTDEGDWFVATDLSGNITLRFGGTRRVPGAGAAMAMADTTHLIALPTGNFLAMVATNDIREWNPIDGTQVRALNGSLGGSTIFNMCWQPKLGRLVQRDEFAFYTHDPVANAMTEEYAIREREDFFAHHGWMMADSEDNLIVVYADDFHVAVFSANFRVRAIFGLVPEKDAALYRKQRSIGAIASNEVYPYCFVLPDDSLVWFDVFQRRIVEYPCSIWKSRPPAP